jgi:predicted O-linked N-acetylglucosamine transferase (SPINDLY family)
LHRLDAVTKDPATARAVADEIGPSPFYLPYQGENDVVPQSIFGGLVSRVLAATHSAVPLAPRPGAGRDARVRLGIVSGFFRDHTVYKIFLEGWLAELDRDRFEVIGFHTGRDSDEVTSRAALLCDRFVRDLPSKPDWRQAIADAAPHVLIYPEVGMDPIVGWLAPQRLARVQCAAWGHPETTGLPTIDYFLSSELMEPPDADGHYTERLVRLPRLGLHFTPDERAAAVLERRDLGLDPVAPVFWCGQSLFKYLPRHDPIFPRIAQAVGECQFVFVSNVSRAVTAAFRERLGRAFADSGLEFDRHCVILPPMRFERYIGAAGLADAVLDTVGWTGGKSTLDCLALNPAIVTLPGQFMRGRQTAAILRHIGCEATIAASVNEYVAIAARLGLDPQWRAGVRSAMAAGKHRVFRDQGYVRKLECFLAEAVARS